MEEYKRREKKDLKKKLGEMKFELEYTISSHFRKKTRKLPKPDGGDPDAQFTERTSRGSDSDSASSEDAPTLADHRFHAKALHIAQTNLDTIKKMMPIKESERSHFIFGTKGSYKPSTFGTSSQAKKEDQKKYKAVDFNIEYYPELNRRFHSLWTGDPNSQDEQGEAENHNIRAPDLSFIPVYNQIRSLDIGDSKIEKWNYSGPEVCDKHSLTNSKSERLVDSMNHLVTIIWLGGCGGAFKLSKRYTKDFVESFWIENF